MNGRNLFYRKPLCSFFATGFVLFATSAASAQSPNAWATGRINTVQAENPQASMQITRQSSTVDQQAAAMLRNAQTYRNNPQPFLQLYQNAPYAQQMMQYVQQHPNATQGQARQDAVNQFSHYINDARSHGHRVSNHLNTPGSTVVATDVTLPQGGPAIQNQVEQRFNQLGCSVLPEGDHWHVQCNRTQGPQTSGGATIRMDENAQPGGVSPAIAPRQSGQSAPTAALRF